MVFFATIFSKTRTFDRIFLYTLRHALIYQERTFHLNWETLYYKQPIYMVRFGGDILSVHLYIYK